MRSFIKNLIIKSLWVYPVLLSAPAFSNEVFVSPTGDAKSSGTTLGSPTTINSALKQAMPGDIILFLDGIYSQPLVLTKSGTSNAPITLKAQAGATPVFRGPTGNQSDGVAAATDVSNYIIDGLWFEGWSQAGIGLSWNHHVDGIVIRNCVTDFNGIAGIGPYFASHVTLQNNIASRNGYGPNSWSSNFDVYGISGADNQVVGNVAFHGVDTSAHRSDGNGFILDLTIDQGTAVFKNNIGFLNGGSCITVTDSGNAQLIGNTCFSDSQYGAGGEIRVGNTCRSGIVGKVSVNGKPYTFNGLELHHNWIAPSDTSNKGISSFYSNCGGPTTYVDDGNTVRYLSSDDLNKLNPLPPEIDPATIPLGFDFQCIKKETDLTKMKFPFWKFAPDFDYIHQIGGIGHCFVSQTNEAKVRHQEKGARVLSSGNKE